MVHVQRVGCAALIAEDNGVAAVGVAHRHLELACVAKVVDDNGILAVDNERHSNGFREFVLALDTVGIDVVKANPVV